MTTSQPTSAQKQQKEPREEVKPNTIAVINEKISVYKSDRKKIASSVKKEEYKSQVMDLNSYRQKVFNEKKALGEKQLKVEKVLAFLPNTHLSPGDFQQQG